MRKINVDPAANSRVRRENGGSSFRRSGQK